jgi:hypothetical protein
MNGRHATLLKKKGIGNDAHGECASESGWPDGAHPALV